MKKITNLFLVGFVLLVAACEQSGESKLQQAEKSAINFYQTIAKDPKQAIPLIFVEGEEAQSNNKKDVEGKLEYMTTSLHREITQRKGISKIAVVESKFLTEQDKGYKGEESTVNIVLNLEFNDGTSKKEPVLLVYVDKKWFIYLR